MAAIIGILLAFNVHGVQTAHFRIVWLGAAPTATCEQTLRQRALMLTRLDEALDRHSFKRIVIRCLSADRVFDGIERQWETF